MGRFAQEQFLQPSLLAAGLESSNLTSTHPYSHSDKMDTSSLLAVPKCLGQGLAYLHLVNPDRQHYQVTLNSMKEQKLVLFALLLLGGEICPAVVPRHESLGLSLRLPSRRPRVGFWSLGLLDDIFIYGLKNRTFSPFNASEPPRQKKSDFIPPHYADSTNSASVQPDSSQGTDQDRPRSLTLSSF